MRTETGPRRVAFIGECMIELQRRPSGDIKQAFAGDTLNAAVYLARLTSRDDVCVEYVTAVGEDAFSQAMLDEWRREGVGTDRVRRLPDALPGLYFIETDERGERRFHYWRSESAARRCFADLSVASVRERLSGFDWIYLSGISLAILPPGDRETLLRALDQCRSEGTRIAFDNNFRPRLWSDPDVARAVHRRILGMTDLALLTWEDEQQLFGFAGPEDLFDAYADCATGELVVKRGPGSCLIKTDGDVIEVPAEPVAQVVDTTAAGDSFSAAYLAERLLGGSPRQAAHQGHRIAATVIQHRGALIDPALMPERTGLQSSGESS